uniref:Uncharacterized protein n=1 Tax=Oryza barthii TaxID=65489 RepID=A0A0D3F3R0_9ORYZ
MGGSAPGYEGLLSHVASHGFIAVLYGIALDLNDATRKVACWAADERLGLAYVLGSVLNLPGVKPDLSRLALTA